ncbi:MAG: DUF3352 domain-containing protein [Deltaproteobacteria bacterium]|nr:DUF3352 domain-containing protein [Deltaproteobacteria bacterium]
MNFNHLKLRNFTVLTSAITVALALTSCRGCQQKQAIDIRTLPAGDTHTAFIVNNFNDFINGLNGFFTKLTSHGGAEQFSLVRQKIKQQYNFDIFDSKSFNAWGIDPQAGLIAFTEGQSQKENYVLAIGINDQQKFDEIFKKYIAAQLSSDKFGNEQVGKYTLQRAGRPFGTEIVYGVSWVHVGNVVLVAFVDGDESIRTVLKRLEQNNNNKNKNATNLLNDAVFRKTTAKIPAKYPVLYVRGDINARKPIKQNSKNSLFAETTIYHSIATSIKIDDSGLNFETYIELPVPGSNFDKALASEPPVAMLKHIAANALIAGISRAAKPKTLAAIRTQPFLLQWLNQVLSLAHQETSLDPEKEILPLLTGASTLSVYLNKFNGVAGKLQRRPSFNSLLDFIHIVATAEVTDEKAMFSALENSRKSMQKRGIEMNLQQIRFDKKEIKIYTRAIPKNANATFTPKLGWALFGNTYVYAAGANRLSQALNLLKGGEPTLEQKLASSSIKLTEQTGTSVLIIRPYVLLDELTKLKKLDTNNSVDIVAMIPTALKLLQAIGDIVISVSGEPDGLRIKLSEQLQ